MCSDRRVVPRSVGGFTLIEMMLVTAILGILAAVALPVFRSYQLRARTAEVGTNISTIMKSQRTFKASHDVFANIAGLEGNDPYQPGGVVWAGAGCNPACSRTNLGACTEFACIGFQVVGRVHYAYGSATNVPQSDYCISALADLDQDGTFGEYEFQSDEGETGVGVVNCLATSCPVGLVPEETMNCRITAY